MFLSIICSPTSSLISKEGDNFWLLKTNPKGITIPLIAKSLIGVTISFCSLMVTIILICTLKYIAWLQGLILIGICIIYIIGLVSCGIFINLVRPNLFKNNKEKKSNMVLHMIIGVVISIFLGIFSIIGSFNLKFTYIILVCLAVVLVYTLLFSILTITLNKKLFNKMEA
jgi:ABC-2 type transport system permease protein